MPYVHLPPARAAVRMASAEARWHGVLAVRPDLEPAVALQRRLIGLVVQLDDAIASGRLPRLSLPPRYVAAKLGRGIPALTGEPVPLPVAALKPTLLKLCRELAQGGAGGAADHIGAAIEAGRLDAGSLLAASLAREQDAIRTAAAHHGFAADLLWLVAELAASPYVHALMGSLFAPDAAREPLAAALAAWAQGYCPACGSWPAVGEATDGRRILRCSFCAAAWDASAGCVYCGERGAAFASRPVGRAALETCGACSGYLKTVAVAELSAFPLLAIADLETIELDMQAMQQGFGRPRLREFPRQAPIASR